MTRERAIELRRIIEQAASFLNDEVAIVAPELFKAWEEDTEYVVGDRRRDRTDGFLYKCVQAHTSQSDWEPHNVPALWARVAEPGDEWPEWIQPTGAQDAYMQGDKVSHDGKHWVSAIDNNVWEPGAIGTETLWIEE